MFVLPDSSMKLNNNILVNLHNAYIKQSTINAAIHEFRGVIYVWDVVKNIENAISLPGGIYNFGSSDSLNTYELLLSTAILMGFKKAVDVIHLDKEKFCGLKRNLTMDCSSIKKYNIFFKSSIDSIKDALQKPFRRNKPTKKTNMTIDTTNMCSLLQKKLFQPDGIYYPVWKAIQDDIKLTTVVRNRQLHIYRNGEKILILAGKAKPKIIKEDKINELIIK